MKRTVAAIAALLVCSVASAQELGTGVESLQAGGGISDFTGAAASALTKLGATLDIHLGLHFAELPISAEVGYVASTHPTNDIMGPLAGNASINSNGLEGLVRYNFRLRAPVSPYVFGGVGWDHWSLGGGAQSNPLAIQGDDNTAVFPFGGGVEYPFARHWDVESRFTYRTTILDDMLLTNAAGQPNAGAKSFTTWNMTARVGYLF